MIQHLQKRGGSLSSGLGGPRPPGAQPWMATAFGPCFAGLIAGLMAFLGAALPANAAESPGAISTFRMGFSKMAFGEVNENDAKAAVKVWGQTIAKAEGISVNPDPLIYGTFRILRDSFLSGSVDAAAITLPDYRQLRREIALDPLFVTRTAGSTTEQYLLLVRREGPVKSLADLSGRSLGLQNHMKSNLALLWLDVLLRQQGHPMTARFARSIHREAKLTKVILPVFFGQMDACVVTRGGYETMCELSPLVGKQLAILATSPEYVPSVFAFRASYRPPAFDRLSDCMKQLGSTPSGHQVLTIFQSDSVEQLPASSLDSALELLATHERLCLETIASPTDLTANPGLGGKEIGK